MITINKEELRAILASHAKWLAGDAEGGARADLSGTRPQGAVDLSGADLRQVVAKGADLRGCVLARADLQGAILRNADLRGVDLHGSDLRNCDLYAANMRGADLRGADLRGAGLSSVIDFPIHATGGVVVGATVMPDGVTIATLCFGWLRATITPTVTTIGCQTHPNEDWLRWTPENVAPMHTMAAEWWRKHGEAVKAVIRCVSV